MTHVLKNPSFSASKLIANMYLNEEYADFHFVFEFDDYVQKVPANKTILASQSPVFNVMFYGSIKEQGDVKIVDVEVASFKEFLQLFYLGEITFNMENIEDIVRLSDKYDVLECINASVLNLKNKLTIDNMCWIYQLALFLEDKKLIKMCENRIMLSPDKIFATDAFQRCKRSTLKRILELDLICKETDVFEASLKWAKYECQQNNLDETQGVNLRSQLGDFLILISFSEMTVEEFSLLAKSNHGLFTQEEFDEIFFNLTSKEYKSKIFNKRRLRSIFMWNPDEVLFCQRINNHPNEQPYNLIQNRETICFSSSQLVLLGSIQLAPVHNLSCIDLQNNAINITIIEICRDSLQNVWYEGDSKDMNINLPEPILIKPQNKYEIQLKVPLSAFSAFYYGVPMQTVQLGNNLTITFHPGTKPDITLETKGWVQSLGLNRV